MADQGASIRSRVYEVLERSRRHDALSVSFDVFMVSLIVANVTAAVIETVPEIQARWGRELFAFDLVCVAIFIVEYALRIWAAPEHPVYRGMGAIEARLRLMRTPLLILDLVAILPIFLEIFWGQNAGFIRIIRIVRFYRLARYVPALMTLGRVLGAEWRRLAGTLVLFAALLLLTGVLMYVAEGRVQPERLGSVPAAMWWAVVTLSTVGYGDVVPVTGIGKVIAGLTMILGIMFLALPVGIIASGFQNEIKRRDFVVNFALVARVPLFARLDAAAIAQLVGILTARRVAAGTHVVMKGDAADAMYFIVAGLVEVEIPGKPVRLREGDFFGEIALIGGGQRTANVMVIQPSELLQLEARDFRRLAERNPQIAEAVREVASQRQAELK